MAMTYNSLVAQISAYLDRTDADTLAEIPNFIALGEQRICRDSKNIGFEQAVTTNFIIGNPVLPKPSRWRRTISFNYGSGDPITVNQIRLRSYEYLRNYWPNPTLNAPPQYYSDYAYDHFLIAPTPDLAYPFELIYLELPQPISVGNQTNWITVNAPDLIFFAAMMEATLYLKIDERYQFWEKRYLMSLASVNQQDDMRVADRAIDRSSD